MHTCCLHSAKLYIMKTTHTRSICITYKMPNSQRQTLSKTEKQSDANNNLKLFRLGTFHLQLCFIISMHFASAVMILSCMGIAAFYKTSTIIQVIIIHTFVRCTMSAMKLNCSCQQPLGRQIGECWRITVYIIIIINVKIIVTLSQKLLQGHCTKRCQNLQSTLCNK